MVGYIVALIRSTMKPIFTNYSCAPNKAFKRDSCRVAFLVCGSFVVKVVCGKLAYAAFTP
ncbi:DUF3265 domain-containing protein [Vibrio vulnificus]|nr:DUF3265 domain-containing protein [Vibrio vulnificus]